MKRYRIKCPRTMVGPITLEVKSRWYSPWEEIMLTKLESEDITRVFNLIYMNQSPGAYKLTIRWED